jgi:hypothetical protein
METGILSPELKSIGQLFSGDTRYAVPKYQRSFAWGSDEVEELWEDLLAAMMRSGNYFLGSIVVHTRSHAPQDIIDGQQRLTCISMIFSAIRNVFLAAHDERGEQIFLSFLGSKDFSRGALAKPKLVLNKHNNETYVKHVIDSHNLDQVHHVLKGKDLTLSNRLLLEAYAFFLHRISSEVGKKGTESDSFLVPLIDCLRTSVKLITIPVTSEEDANLFFESVNARGKELAISDLVKNRLFLEAADHVNRAEHLWDQMEVDLARRPIPEFLRHFWIAKQIEEKNALVREKQLYRMVAQQVKGKREGTLQLLNDLSSSARDYAKITDYELWPDDSAYDSSLEDLLRELQLFRVSQCDPVLLNAIQGFAAPKDVVKVFRTVSNFSFRYFIIGNQSPGNLERVSNGIAVGIRKGTLATPKDVADEFRAVSPDATFRSDFALAVLPRNKAKLARYILGRIANHISRQAGKSGGESIVNPDAKQVTLEHVLPQSIGPKWRNEFSKGIKPEDYLFRLGNLTLLTAKINREAADGSFVDKQAQALKTSGLPINRYFHQLSHWVKKKLIRDKHNSPRSLWRFGSFNRSCRRFDTMAGGNLELASRTIRTDKSVSRQFARCL